MKTEDFDYYLPQELIAQDPVLERSSSRLMIVDKNSGELSHRHFYDIIEYFNPGDCLVLNETKVIPARLLGTRVPTGGKVELLLLKRLGDNEWETLTRPGKKCRIGAELEFGDGLLRAAVVDILEDGNRRVRFSYEGIFEELLDRLGQMPLPPYIHHKLKDKNRYQTVYARVDGSAAAPTAGLHFTEEILEALSQKGVNIAKIILHVGLGTFRPVKESDITRHHMHSEYYEVSDEAAGIINQTKEKGGRIIAAGTTATRTLETAADDKGRVCAGNGWTDIFIYPGYSFKCIDGLITNFHLPQSTLLMLVSAFAGREHVLAAYSEAVREKYRFFSFGDAMLLA